MLIKHLPLLVHGGARGSGSQFATPPRFQFPDETNGGDAFKGSSGLRQVFSQARHRRYDIISPLRSGRHKPLQISDDEIEDDFDDTKDTSHGVEASTGLDDLFDIPKRSNKRARTSLNLSQSPARISREGTDDVFDEINDSSPFIPDSPPSPPAQNKPRNVMTSPLSQLGFDQQPFNNEFAAPETFDPLSEPQTPDHALEYDDGRSSSRPRFILSANYTPVSTATPSTSTRQNTRKKPTFVLPRSPSPDREDASLSAIPGPFSPVATRSLRRPGRPKSSVTAAYMPGGMAEQLRDWIMETDMKRKATSEQSRQKREDRYSMIGKVHMCENAYLKSSGPVIRAQVKPELAGGKDSLDSEHGSQPMTILLLGVAASRSRTNSTGQSTRDISAQSEKLKPGDIIGVGSGLSWEVEVDSFNVNHKIHNNQTRVGHRVVASSCSKPEDEFEDEDEVNTDIHLTTSTCSTRKTWRVVAEWDLLSQT
ncbi:conserved hypothetical protein [Talaromyces stipitatus ATCC 10500]|uniref:Uncharacterized protein n=1 Tax=Talaromyces stipitatus (strain ATCC 10500 / CBS 375.48 / QM 6759 / NRRL 1006) TaxID=441959 RepID=B8MCK7_TALSN|nr:uncharacterized protein TSTA_125370 [Talaromyces stipitatus ATCC 10500]EED18823.1 conserved hypothetical protein [Talaromyces stipitatus ATCC 10500]